MGTDYIGYIYAITIAIGGVVGYITKGSLTSCGMGLGAGGLAGLAAYRSSVSSSNWGLSLFVSIALSALMGFRFAQSGKFMPAGLVAGLSVLMLLRYGYRALTSKKEKL
eukprot:TRINITY_DN79846_c0_g1_i1.p2 TRINITY_DN79846_c0_g1~~TRINITY_DN79846_c0_g1_i1.p2  ORF type:complete len:109 (+),score=16.67 TRINITY_DN79846_c0_g1_i1:36-362(+)